MARNVGIGSRLPEFALAAYLPAFPSGGSGANPHFAALTVTSSFIGQLLELQSLCEVNNLWRVEVVGSPDSWGTDHELFRIDMPTLTVQGSQFWFRDMPIEIYNAIETSPYRIDKLQYLFDARKVEGDRSAAFLADDPMKLFDTVKTLSAATKPGCLRDEFPLH